MADPDVGPRELQRVRDVLASGQLAAGEVVDDFEAEFAAYCGVDHGVATCNGTAALHAALRALGVGEGDAVVTTPFSFVATANAIRLVGAEPVFADVDPETYALDPEAVAAHLRERDDVAAVLAVHLYGLPAPMEELADLADAHDVALVEDACQAHGAAVDGERVPVADVGCFSFYPTKNMTTGEGGVIATDRDDVAERARRFVDHGRTGSHTHVDVGHNFRMTDLAAAIGRVQLEKLPDYVAARRSAAEQYAAVLEDAPVAAPTEPDGHTHAYNQYTVRCRDRERFREHMRRYGVDTAVYYPTPIHRQPAYEDVDASLPVAERLSDEVCSLPVHPNLSDRDRSIVTTALAEYEAETDSSGREADDAASEASEDRDAASAGRRSR